MIELEATALAAGGDAISRDAGGRVVFVAGALPGERVRARLVAERRDFARAKVVEVLDASPFRVTPACPQVAEGCGGCDLQHVTAADQPALKATVVTDALRRLGRVDDPEVRAGVALAPTAFRTTVRAAVVDGRAGFRRARSHEVVATDHCLVAHPALDELLAEGDFGAADEVTLRVGAATGERLALVTPTAAGVRLPTDVRVVGDDEVRAGRRAWFHEVVDGRRYRISAPSFFQSRADGAAALVDAVRDAAGDALGPGTVIDAYCGVGLFAGAFASRRDFDDHEAVRVLAVERGSSSVADARHNLRDLRARVVQAPVEKFRPSPARLVVADPSRTGLGARAVGALAATRAPRLVLVSCDPAALGRDTALLAARGYRFDHATLVDLFPHTHHVEVVSRFDLDPDVIRNGEPRRT